MTNATEPPILEEFLEAGLTERVADLETIRSALFHAEMDRRGTGPGSASFGSVMSRSEETATKLLAFPRRVYDLWDRDQVALASIWSGHPDFRPEWTATEEGKKA
ncbi:hypothetical protein [Nocardia sp. NPDC019302]|uniref:hypothetical protein n=1 Tax=Nocardia sp. NPDC019302 TaxID=3154592 RepID=UPI0034015DFB